MAKGKEKKMDIDINDFAIVLTPKHRKNKWTGEVDINIKYEEDNFYTEEERDSIINLMTLMATCVDLMETDPDLLQRVFEHRDYLEEKNVNAELHALDVLEAKVDSKPEIIKRVGNVIKINWTKQ